MPYSTRADAETYWGKDNILAWADADNRGILEDIEARYVYARDLADEIIDARLREGPYEIPFTTVPAIIKDLSIRLTGVLLYDLRGLHDPSDEFQNPLKFHQEYVEKMLGKIHAGQYKFDSTITRKADTTYPTITEQSAS